VGILFDYFHGSLNVYKTRCQKLGAPNAVINVAVALWNILNLCFVFQNCSLGVVGKDMDFTIYDDEKVEQYVSFT
jgi:hypothetical protein